MDKQDRYQRGLAKLREIDGEAGERVLAGLDDIAPDFARYLIEFPFGDIYSRPGLDLKSREIAVVAARWRQAYEDGCAPPVMLQATNALALSVVPAAWLLEHAVDVPDDLSSVLGPEGWTVGGETDGTPPPA